MNLSGTCSDQGMSSHDARPFLWSKAMNTKMSRAEKIVAGLAAAVLVAGFATAVFAKPASMSPHGSLSTTHAVAVQAQQND
jgi:hypothetical protein